MGWANAYVVINGYEYIIYKKTNGNNQGYGYMPKLFMFFEKTK